jgi:hypothetical protein
MSHDAKQGIPQDTHVIGFHTFLSMFRCLVALCNEITLRKHAVFQTSWAHIRSKSMHSLESVSQTIVAIISQAIKMLQWLMAVIHSIVERKNKLGFQTLKP